MMMMLEIFLRLRSFENKYYLQHHLEEVPVHFYCDKLAPNTRLISK